jgi:hypothetical protein
MINQLVGVHASMKDKLIFWLDADITNFCLAYYLQKKYEADYFAIIDITNKPKKFFQEQKLVDFQKTWFYHDNITKSKQNPNLEYLTSIEKKYNVRLWELAINERIFYRFNRFYKFNTNEILSILEQECKLFEKILDEIKPDFFITTEPPLHHQELFYEMCKNSGVKPLVLNQPHIRKCIISERTKFLDEIDDLKNIKDTNHSFEELRNRLKTLNLFDQIKDYKSKFKTSKYQRLKSAIEFLIFSKNINIKTHYSYYGRTKLRVLFDAIKFSLKARYRNYFINKTLETKINSNEKFVYFPLGVEEERSLLISAPFYNNQIEIIRDIVKSLPVEYKLYVKESLAQAVRYWRSISEYKEIMCIPNVRLFHPSVPSEIFHKNCSLVITIGGTSSFEAAFYEKPSIVFTDLGYTVLPSIFRVQSPYELHKIIKIALQTKVNRSDLARYLTLLEKNSFSFDLLGIQTKYFHHFYFDGNLVDVNISTPQMKSFLDENSGMLQSLALEYIKKIKTYKEHYNEDISN